MTDIITVGLGALAVLLGLVAVIYAIRWVYYRFFFEQKDWDE